MNHDPIHSLSVRMILSNQFFKAGTMTQQQLVSDKNRGQKLELSSDWLKQANVKLLEHPLPFGKVCGLSLKLRILQKKKYK